MSYPEGMKAHLASGVTTIARAYAVTRQDGLVLGFTDHDRDLRFEGIVFRADTGLTAKALQTATGLSVDNSEAFGALRSDAITDADILAGRYDGADVRAWLVNWADPEMRVLQFRGSLGEITRAGSAFSAELRGLSEALNRPQGWIYHGRCSAVLGDARCRFDLSLPGYAVEREVEAVEGGRVFTWADFATHEPRFFEKGRFEVLTGAAAGLVGVVKGDLPLDAVGRQVELWQALGAPIAPGDRVRLTAGCDKRAETCRLRFHNLMNFRGFPDIPGEDWLMSYPVAAGVKDGGSLKK